MICEKLDTECPYLDVLNEILENDVLIRATEKREYLIKTAENNESIAYQWIQQSQAICQENRCGVISKAIIEALSSQAKFRIIQDW